MTEMATINLPDDVQSLSQLIGIQSTTQAALYVGVAALALLVYEYLITLDLEIKYIWTGRRISVTGVFFFVNRYYSLVRAAVYIYWVFNLPANPISTTCIRMMDFNSWSTMLSVLTVELLMLLRAWALWNRRRDVGFFFIALCCGGVTAAIATFWNRSLYLPWVVPLPPNSLLPCYRPSPFKYVAAYVIALAVECISLVFMLGRVVWLRYGIKHDVPILKALGAQGVYYFVVVISTMGFTVFAGYFEKLARPVLFSGITPSITSLACTRVFLALRGSYLQSGTDNPPDRKHGTFSSYHGPGDDRNLSLDFYVSNAGETTAISTSAGAYEITTVGNATVGTELSSIEDASGAPPLQPRQPRHHKPHIEEVP